MTAHNHWRFVHNLALLLREYEVKIMRVRFLVTMCGNNLCGIQEVTGILSGFYWP